MDYRTRYIHVYRMQIFVDCGTAGAEHNVTQLWLASRVSW